VSDGSKIFFIAEAVRIPAAMEQLLEYGKHIPGDLFIDGPHVRQIKAAVFRRVPPGQEEVGNNAALPAVSFCDPDQSLQRRGVHFSSVPPVGFDSSFAGCVAVWMDFNWRIDTCV